MNILEKMFCGSAMERDIQETHQSIITRLQEVLDNCDVQDPRVIDLLSIPEFHGLPKHNSTTLSTTASRLLDPSAPKFNDLGVFSHVQCKVLTKLHETAKMMLVSPRGSLLASPLSQVKTHQLEELFMVPAKPSGALGFKYAWLYANRDGEKKAYYGTPAFTTPVAKFFKELLRISNPSAAIINEVTFDTAHELKMDPLDTNTAMWLMGLKLS